MGTRKVFFALSAVVILVTSVSAKPDITEPPDDKNCKSCFAKSLIAVSNEGWCAKVDSCTIQDVSVTVLSETVINVQTFRFLFNCSSTTAINNGSYTGTTSQTWTDLKYEGDAEVKIKKGEAEAEGKEKLVKTYGQTSGASYTVPWSYSQPIKCMEGKTEVQVTELAQNAAVGLSLQVKGRGVRNFFRQKVHFEPEDQITTCFQRFAADIEPFTFNCDAGKVTGFRFGVIQVGAMNVIPNGTDCSQKTSGCGGGSK